MSCAPSAKRKETYSKTHKSILFSNHEQASEIRGRLTWTLFAVDCEGGTQSTT